MPGYPYVDFQGIQEAAYGMSVPSEAQASVDRLIEKAGHRLAARVPRIKERVAAGTLPEALVAGVIEDMVIRVLRNPHGFSSEQAGDFMYRIDRAVASGKVQATDDDVSTLLDAENSGPVFGRVNLSVPAWRLP